MRDSTLDRREFTLASLMAMLSGVVITISGCGGGGSSPGGPSNTPDPNGGKVGSISANHGHVAVITLAQLTAAGDLQLSIMGSATHNHVVELTAAQVVAIRDGSRISRSSSTTEAHDHSVTFN